MPVKREGQLEKCIDDATRKHDFQALEQFLETDFSDGISHKCSKQFLNKVDKLICQGLKNEEVENISTLLNTLQKHGRNINILGEVGFPAMIEYGLVQKTKEILQNRVNEQNDQFTTLIEDLFDVVMIVHDTNSEGKMQILENFILRTCILVTDKRMSIYIQQEALRRLNTMLGAMPRDTRKKIISTKEMSHVMNDMANRILDAGDYDLQVAITEALCRMTSEKQRGELASQWFSMEFVSSAFKGIKDSEFETDCRKFLNQVNGILGDKRRVFTYPCLSAFLGIHELQVPVDDHLEDFWVDFNIGSRSISFYIAADEGGHQWETVSIPEEEVAKYIIEEKEKGKKKLTINLKNPMSVSNQTGEEIILQFDSALQIIDAAAKVYGANKCEGFTRKNTMSVAKTTVHVIFDESGSQVLVPESQVSPLAETTCKPLKEKGSYSLQHQYLPTENNLTKKDNTVDFPTVQSKVTPGKRKVSEASMIVPCTARFPRQSPLPPVNASTPRKDRVKMPLQMMNAEEKMDSFPTCERTKNLSVVDDEVCASSVTNSHKNKHIPVEKVVNMIHDEEDLDVYEKHKLDDLDVVPDSQPGDRNDKPLLPGILETSVAEIKIQKKQMCWVPEKIIANCNKQNDNAPDGSLFHQAPNLSVRAAKQKAFSSIFEITSPVLRSQQCCYGEILEQQQNEINKIPVKSDKRSSAESRNSFMHLNEKISKNSSTKIVPSKSEIALNATRMSDSSVNLRVSKLVTGTNDEASFDVPSPGRETTKEKTGQKGRSKEMVEAAKTLINKISDRYKQKDGVKSTRNLCQSFSYGSTSLNKPSFSDSKPNKNLFTSCLSTFEETCKKKSRKRSSRNLKTTTLLNVTTGQLTDDVYNFNLSGFDEPTIKLGIQEFHHTKLEGTTNLLKKMNDGNDGKSGYPLGLNRTNKNKQHLFSDTDTEYRGDDTKTDISWLKESNRKPKPQLIDYGRTRKQKKSQKLEANKPPMSSTRKRSQQKKTKQNKEKKGDSFNHIQGLTTQSSEKCKVPVPKNQSVSEAEKKTQPIRSRQPRRAALAKKSYKELSDSETDSAEETSAPLIKKNTLKEHVQQRIVSSETAKGKSANQEETSTTSKDGMPRKKMELSPMASSVSPTSIEIMRCCGKSPESTQERISVRQSSLSSFLQELTPEKEETVSNIEEMPAFIKTNKESAQLKQLSEKGKKPVAKNESLSPTLSPLSLPNFTPFATSKTFASDCDEEVADPEDKIYDADEALSIKNHSLGRSSDTELKGCSENLMKNRREVSKSPSELSTPCRSRELWHKVPLAQIHESGPTIHPNFKRQYQNDTGSDSEEVEIRRKESKRKLLPRKLFKADDSTYKVSESVSTLSINDTSVFDGEGWDADNSSVGMICQKLKKQCARKIQYHSKRMDSFTKQSLKAAHQHMNTMRTELHEHRTKQLKNFHACIIKELENFEKDSLALKNTEKEFSNILKKHFEIFTTYRKSEQQRLQSIKASFEKNIYYTADCEDNIFNSEMHLMKEDMKGLQERLLKEMREEELLNVRKGLQLLFMAEDRKF